MKLRKQTPAGYSGYAVICGVKFIPIAGYSSDDPDIKLMSQSNAIEVWLVSLPGTAMYAPYRIVLPTGAGPVSATSTSFRSKRGDKAKLLYSWGVRDGRRLCVHQ